jgi:hypothetical protein
MFKRHVSILILLLLVTLLNGCVYTNVVIPLDEDVWETKLGEKKGVSATHSILGLVAWGDAGTLAAARAGNINIIHHMDMGVESYLFGVYSKRETIVYGD